MSQALAVRDVDSSSLAMQVAPVEAEARYRELQAFVKAAMVANVDYGTIPGTNKPSLYQPGAQKLAELYGFAVSYVDVAALEDWDKGLFVYRKKCILTSRRDGRFIGDGIGSCNSKEDKYGWRWVGEKAVPPGLDRATLRTKKNEKGWVQYRVPNDDVYSIVNTIEKMACKRALIHAVISATRSSGLFTQDCEDLPPEMFGRTDAVRSWAGTVVEIAPAPRPTPREVPHDADGVVVEPAAATAYAARYEAATTLDEVEMVRGQVKAAYGRKELGRADVEALKPFLDGAITRVAVANAPAVAEPAPPSSTDLVEALKARVAAIPAGDVLQIRQAIGEIRRAKTAGELTTAQVIDIGHTLANALYAALKTAATEDEVAAIDALVTLGKGDDRAPETLTKEQRHHLHAAVGTAQKRVSRPAGYVSDDDAERAAIAGEASEQ